MQGYLLEKILRKTNAKDKISLDQLILHKIWKMMLTVVSSRVFSEVLMTYINKYKYICLYLTLSKEEIYLKYVNKYTLIMFLLLVLLH